MENVYRILITETVERKHEIIIDMEPNYNQSEELARFIGMDASCLDDVLDKVEKIGLKIVEYTDGDEQTGLTEMKLDDLCPCW